MSRRGIYDARRRTTLITLGRRVTADEIGNAGRTAVVNSDGSVTFTATLSGDNGIDDGVALVFEAVDQRGRPFDPDQNGNTFLTTRHLRGDVGFSVPTLPTLGAGLKVGIGVCFGPIVSTTDRRAVLSVVDFESTPRVAVDRLAPTLARVTGTGVSSIRGVRTSGGGHHYATRPVALPYQGDGSPAIGGAAPLGVDNMGATPLAPVAPTIVLACWREGVSVGSESVTVYPWSLLDLLDTTEVPL